MAVRPVKASGIAGVTPAQREGIMKLFPRRGTGEILRDYEQAIVQGGRSDLVPGGFLPPIPNYVPSKQADTAGQLFLQSLGNLGIDALNVGREASGIMLAAPFAAADIFNAPTDSGYLRSLDDFAQGILDMETQQAAQAAKAAMMARGAGRRPASMTGTRGGPTYTQTLTDADQDAAIRSQMAQAQDLGEGSITSDGSILPGNIFEESAKFVNDPYAIQDKLFQTNIGEMDPERAAEIAAAEAQRKAGEQREAAEAAIISDDATVDGVGRAEGETSTNVQGDVTDITDQPDDLVEQKADSAEEVEGVDLGEGQTAAEKAFMSGMEAYKTALGEDASVGSIEDYKKEFAEATGIDVSGKVDNSAALMSFGLALMQNKAGKGFNVGRMLSSVGEAGEKAMPAVMAARKEAKAGQLAAGKYALGERGKAITNAIARRNKIADRIAELSDKAYDRDTQLMVERLKGQIKLEDRRIQELAANQRESTKSLADAGKLGDPKKILVGGFDKNKFEVQAQQVGDTNVFQIINPKGAMRTVDSMIRGSSSGLETARRMKEIAASGEITGYQNLFNTIQLFGEGLFSVPYSGEVNNSQAEYKAAVGKMLTQFRRLLTGGEAGNAISDRDVAIIEKNLGYLEQALLGNVAVSSQEIVAKVENLEEMFEARLRDHSDFKRSLIEMGQPAGQYMEYDLGEDDNFTDDFLPDYTLTRGPTGNHRYVLKG